MPNTTRKQIKKLNLYHHHHHQAKDTFGVISNLLVLALKILCEGLSPLFCAILIFELNSNDVVPCLSNTKKIKIGENAEEVWE